MATESLRAQSGKRVQWADFLQEVERAGRGIGGCRVLRTRSDARQVTGDIHARYFGTELSDESLVPLTTPQRLGKTRFEAWFGAALK